MQRACLVGAGFAERHRFANSDVPRLRSPHHREVPEHEQASRGGDHAERMTARPLRRAIRERRHAESEERDRAVESTPAESGAPTSPGSTY